MTLEECLAVIEECARGGEVSPTQLRAAVYMLERLEREPEAQPDDLADIYGDADNVTALRPHCKAAGS